MSRRGSPRLVVLQGDAVCLGGGHVLADVAAGSVAVAAVEGVDAHEGALCVGVFFLEALGYVDDFVAAGDGGFGGIAH